MNKIRLIIKREYLTRIRNKSFLLMTFLTPLAVVGIGLLIGYLSQVNKDTVREVFILDPSEQFLSGFKDSSLLHFTLFTQGDEQTLKAQAQAQNAYALLSITPSEQGQIPKVKLYCQDTPSVTILRHIENALTQQVLHYALKSQNLDPYWIDHIKNSLSISVESYSGEERSNIASMLKLVFGGLSGYLLMMFIIIYGNMIMRSVIEEKTNRIIEIIVSSVRPFELMVGKIIGTSLVGLTQVLLWLVIGGILMTLLTSFIGISPSSIPTTLPSDDATIATVGQILIEFFKFPIMKLIGCFFLFFIGGYLLYGSLYTAIGAAVDSETDTQQFVTPIIMPLILAIYIGFFSLTDDPHGVVSVVFSYIPFTSPITMLMRIPFGVSWSEILLSATLLYATFLALLWVASKIYHIGILMYGKKVHYKDLYKWLKE